MGKLVWKVEATAGDSVPSEYSIWHGGVLVGWWAYGCYDPSLPYRGSMLGMYIRSALSWLSWRLYNKL